MNNFWTRIITGSILIIIITSAVMFGKWSFMFLILLINLLGVNEFYTLFKSYSPKKWSGLMFSLILFVTSVLVISGLVGERILIINILTAFGIFLIALYSESDKPFVELAITFLAIIYITIPLILLVFLAFIFPVKGNYHSHTIMGLFLIVWASDSGAYAAGKLFGKHSLFKRVSPNKTLEGSLGGLICTFLVALILCKYYTAISSIHWLVFAAIVVIVGTYGDLIKSILKRSFNVRDSGTILPGHGGILDRFDSLLTSASIVFRYAVLVQSFNL